jgi:predicted nucleic acid-binding protein
VGLIVDSTIFIAAERKGIRATQALSEIELRFPGEAAAVSVITLAELAHGAARANTPQRAQARWQFIREIRTAFPLLPVTADAAIQAGEMDGLNRSRGIIVGFADLLIAATALGFGYSIATANVRHFKMIPGLSVIQY